MQLSRFVQILLLRDVLMYIIPGSIFGVLLCAVGFNQNIAGYAKFLFDSFGQFVGPIVLVAVAYAIGYCIYISTTAIFQRIYKLPSTIDQVQAEKKAAEIEHITSLEDIEDDLIARVSRAVGDQLIHDWAGLLREEVSSDRRGLRYLRYVCEMMVMEKHPEIHHITVERKSSLKNFQTALSGTLMIAGIAGVINAISGLFIHQPGSEMTAVLGVAMMIASVFLFRSLKKMEQELRISIWRAFHAMSLINRKDEL